MCITSIVTTHLPVISAAVSGLTAAKVMVQKQQRQVAPVLIEIKEKTKGIRLPYRPRKPE